MATRRTAPARGRSQTGGTMPPPQVVPRPKSVMAKMQRTVNTTPTPEATPRPPTVTPPTSLAQTRTGKAHITPRSEEESEINMQVVIRCRRRSEREIQENSPIIVSSEGARSHYISIETAAPVSSLGVVTLPPTRTYPFDLVFGPEADQSMIYQDVVHPMLEEVLMGYNCTLFAYGQTGTGKTYTMQGDLGTTPLGNPVASAGMVPRALFRLFHQLEESGVDYSVKVSYIELYNEELRDLLASDLAAPAGTNQPMSMGIGSSRDAMNNAGGLKIFDDASKRGVLIQGLEEIAVKSASDALALLVKGSDRRQIAATKFNDHSSRSHSVFSITVHTKETSSMGDDLLRVGKLNLVDLAGSENIGRSGAENKRAREAGMINQSLLTLGRVINALVEKSSHIPYRESKLTRLLQDSLGGRTKTCIIATISPARSNMEETLSTLDYAIRAKSIRNRPEVNQRMTRNSLLKEYISEIERLKSDLLAAREKNGIFFSEDTWNQMNAEHELARTAMEETKRQVEIVEKQLKHVQDEYQECMSLLTRRDGELKETKEKLSETAQVLTSTSDQLQTTKVALEEEVVVRESHQVTEVTLDQIAQGLKQATQQSSRDLDALFAKLSRKTATMSANIESVLNFGKALTSETHKFSAELDVFINNTTQGLAKLRADGEHVQSKELENLAGLSGRMNTQIERVQDAMSLIQAKDGASSDALKSAQTAVKEAHDSIRATFASWSDKLEKSTLSLHVEMEKSSLNSFQAVEKALNLMAVLIQNIVHETQGHITAERTHIEEAKTMAESNAEEQIRHLKEQNAHLARLLQHEKMKSERMKTDLVEHISGLLDDFVAERDTSLEDAFSLIRGENDKTEATISAFADDHSRKLDEATRRSQEWSSTLENKGEHFKRLRDGAFKSLSSVSDTVREGLSSMQSVTATSLSEYSAEIQRQTHVLHTRNTDAFERHGRAKRARVDATNSLGADIQSESRHLQRAIGATSKAFEASASKITAETVKFSQSAQNYHTSASDHLSSIRKMTDSLLDKGSREDLPTGSTPRKRAWHYVDQWELTKDRDTIIQDWRRKPTTSQDDEPIQGRLSPASQTTDSKKQLLSPDDAQHGDTCESPDPSPPPYVEAEGGQSPTNFPIQALAPVVPTAITLPTAVSNPQAKGKAVKAGSEALHTMGTLTERSTNLLYGRGSRKPR